MIDPPDLVLVYIFYQIVQENDVKNNQIQKIMKAVSLTRYFLPEAYENVSGYMYPGCDKITIQINN